MVQSLQAGVSCNQCHPGDDRPFAERMATDELRRQRVERCETGFRLTRMMLAVLVVVAAAFSVVVAGEPAMAAAPAQPNFMPGFPMLAGNIVMLMWVPVPGAAKYDILLNGRKVADAVAPPYQAPAPEVGGDYQYAVVAVGADGAPSVPSGPGVVKIVTLEPPKAAEVRTFGDSIALRWDASQGASIYNVYRASENGAKKTLLTSTSDLTFKDTKVEDGKTYYYAISAKDMVGKESRLSSEFSAKFEKEKRSSAQEEKAVPLVVKKTKELGLIEFVGSRQRLVNPLDLSIGADGLLYVLDAGIGNIKVMELGLAADPVRVIEFPADEGYGTAYGIGLDGASNVYVVFPNTNWLLAFSSDGKQFLKVKIPRPETKEIIEAMPEVLRGTEPAPIDVAVDSQGRIFIADQKYSRIVVLDDKGRYLAEFGKRGKEKGEFANTVTLAVDKDDAIYVGDPINHRVAKYGKNLALQGYFGNALPSPGSFLGIRGLSFAPEGHLVVSDPSMVTIQYFNVETFEYLYSLGDESGKEMEEGGRAFLPLLGMPNVAIDKNHRVYVPQEEAHAVAVREIGK